MTSEEEKIAAAIRARQSLANDAHPGDVDFSVQGSSGLQFGGTDTPLDDAEQALADDDIENTGDNG